MREIFFAKRGFASFSSQSLSPRWRDSMECCLSRGRVDFARGRKKIFASAAPQNQKVAQNKNKEIN
ncbi:MAG: hypothetical protein LBC07_05480 [Elusimicrobiota bacterium]|nr:hypothetical protein [Elusimicrobiota bacterium]